MGRAFIFSDEAGDLDFTRSGRASRYFMVCSVCMPDCTIGTKLLELRREMHWRDMPATQQFHACEDKDSVRAEVFELIAKGDFRCDVTILEKSKSLPHIRSTKDSFYRYAWYYHFKAVGPRLVAGKQGVQIIAAALGTKKGQAVYTAAVNDVVRQVLPKFKWSTAFPQSVAEPCLQVADYMAWAIQRKWERGDDRWYSKVCHLIETEFDLWKGGSTHHY